ALGAQSGVGGGGRYDGLIEQLGGPPTPGCGWAAGIERMLMAAEERPQPQAGCDLFLAWETSERADAFALATEGRRAGLAAQLDLAGRSIKGQMKQADRAGARYVAILYPDGTVLRDMDSGEEGNVNPNLATGEIEIAVTELELLAESETPPFPLDDDSVEVDEVLRLKHRALDLRRQPMLDVMALRHRIIKVMRDVLDEHDFLEIETPILTRSTPEGARDFPLPSRTP